MRNVPPAKHTTRHKNNAPLRRGTRLPTPPLTLLATIALTLILAGCGSTSSPSQSTAGRSDTTTVADASLSKAAVPSKAASKQAPVKKENSPIVEKVTISSTAFQPAGQIPARYTCDGENTPPPLHWSGIPAGTAALSLYLIKVAPVEKHLLFSWAVAGIDPKSHSIQAGKLPPGAVVGRNSEGNASYDLCPAKGTNEEYVYVLLALPHAQHPKPGFDAAAQRVADLEDANYEGFLVFTYPRH